MSSLFSNIRFYVLVGSIFLSSLIFIWIQMSIPQGELQIIRLEQIFAFTSILYLYITLLIGPLCYIFPWIPYQSQVIKARRAIGVGSFYFAFLHTAIAFFGQLNGFLGLVFLDNVFLTAIIFGFISLGILFLLAITSLDNAVTLLTFPKWKLLHRFVYVAAILILIHTTLLGTHFSDLTGIVSHISFLLLAFLLLLESPRLDVWIGKKFQLPKFSFITSMFAIILGIIYFTFFSPFFSKPNKTISFDIHAAHKQLAQQVQQRNSQNNFAVNISNIPGLNGDRSKRYTVSMISDPVNPLPGQNTTLHFQVFDASTGNHISLFRILFAKQMHCMIVNSALTYFQHIHPTEDSNGNFVITTQFPQQDLYHLYIQFQPFEGIEQQMAFTLPVGQPSTLTFSQAQPNSDTVKTFGTYAVSVNTHGPLQASLMSQGAQQISFTLTDAKTGKPVTNLKPYLASFGHLTMINEKTFDFIHVHPFNLIPPPPDANGGPTVDFLPIGIYGTFKSGTYRAFAEFNPDGKLFVADFTIKVE